jgi:hypothetical protein
VCTGNRRTWSDQEEIGDVSPEDERPELHNVFDYLVRRATVTYGKKNDGKIKSAMMPSRTSSAGAR